MPIYEYQCRECDHRLEKLQKISDAPLADCPACGRPALVKLISAAGFRLKGGGWYETDFKKDGKRNLAGDSGGPDAAKPDSKKPEKAGAEAGKTASPKTDSAAKPKPATTGAAA
ncbi:MAG: FmdB family zinc ribbon protein [Wenzhouxiangellaceae bacterium]